jgi:hypothetical protein
MNNCSIPKSFDLFGTTVNVEYQEMPDHLGYSDYQNRKIVIDPRITNELKNEVFYHEKTHWLFYKMGSELEGDEKFIGMFGDLLYQSDKTAINNDAGK